MRSGSSTNWKASIGRSRSSCSRRIGSAVPKAPKCIFHSPRHRHPEASASPFSPRGRIRFTAPPTWSWRRNMRWSIASSRRSNGPRSREYRERASRKSDLERTELAKEKTGVLTGAFAINPVNGEKIPIWIADYVLHGLRHGRDHGRSRARRARLGICAEKFFLPIREVVSPTPTLGLGGGSAPCEAPPLECFVGEGYAIHSGPLDGLPTADAKQEIVRRLEGQGLGRRTVNYKLRDWLFSRQRYWGEPFPWCGKTENIARFRKVNCRSRRRRWTTSSRLARPSLRFPRPRNGCGTRSPRSARPIPCRNGREAAGTIFATATPETQSASSARRRGLLDDRAAAVRRTRHQCQSPPRRRGSVRGRHGARRAAPALRAVLAQSPLRSRPRLDAGAVSEARQPGNDPRRGRAENVEALGKCRRSARSHRPVWRGCFSLLRDVHGAARADEAVEHDGRRGALALPRPRLAARHGGKPGRRMDRVARGAGCSHRKSRAENRACHDQEGRPKTSSRSPSIRRSRR